MPGDIAPADRAYVRRLGRVECVLGRISENVNWSGAMHPIAVGYDYVCVIGELADDRR